MRTSKANSYETAKKMSVRRSGKYMSFEETAVSTSSMSLLLCEQTFQGGCDTERMRSGSDTDENIQAGRRFKSQENKHPTPVWNDKNISKLRKKVCKMKNDILLLYFVPFFVTFVQYITIIPI